MPKVKEFTVTIEDKPGALGKCFAALAERGVNILAFQSYVEEGESLARLLADDPESAKAVLGEQRMIFEETEAHRPACAPSGRAGTRGIAAGRTPDQHRLLVQRSGARIGARAGGLRPNFSSPWRDLKVPPAR
jgi:hypothetical protein